MRFDSRSGSTFVRLKSKAMAEIKTRKITLKNVKTETGYKDITVEVVPFNDRNDAHVEFAFGVTDMTGRLPSPYANINEAARAYVELFVVHKEEELRNPLSDVSLVRADLRAARTLFNNPGFQKELRDFFENA